MKIKKGTDSVFVIEIRKPVNEDMVLTDAFTGTLK
jgi:hypothetical protein